MSTEKHDSPAYGRLNSGISGSTWPEHQTPNTKHPLLLLRADATRQMGSGHVMRCLGLAQTWEAKGGKALFVTHTDSDALAARLDAAGIERIAVQAPHPHAADLPQTLTLLAERQPAWTVLDGYHFTPCYQEALQEAGSALLVLDDMAHLRRYHADMLVNQNVYADTLHYPCIGHTELRLGSRYALLRPEFARWQGWTRRIPQTAQNVLVTMGGTDPENITQKVIQALDSWRGREFLIKIVVGPGNSHLDALRETVANCGREMTLLVAPDDLPSLMAWADIAVSAAGTTLLELAYMQVPTLAIAIADNQRRVAAGFAQAGIVRDMGWHSALIPPSLACAIRQLAQSPKSRCEMAQTGREYVDGAGVQRLVAEMWERRCCA